MIIVIDSGVWISGLQFGGTPWAAIQKAITLGQIAVCEQIETEIAKTLIGMGWANNRLAETIGLYFEDVIWTTIYDNIRGVCRDPKDDAIIECAVNAKAELIISGDKDLLILKQYNTVRIITPRQYLAPPGNGNDLRSR